ncbi:GNAT family N-acetyltransferase [Roseobacteraceae bacterium NS-SX3]
MIRRLAAADLESYLRLWHSALELAPEAFLLTLEEVRALPDAAVRADLEAGLCWGAFQEENLAGFAVLRPCGPVRLRHAADLGPVYMAPAARGRGLAKRLLAAVLEAAAVGGILQVELCVDETSEAAVSLYYAAGFRRFGRRSRSLLIDGAERNDLLMMKQLDRPYDAGAGA